ncbi:MAG: PEP-CTERM sorting domain-containing protein [Phycisphaerae bacterium]|jgi:hypothetical protein
MRRGARLNLTAVCALIVLLGSDYATAGTWTTIDKVGYSISGSKIVGGQNFLYDDQTWTELNAPTATLTVARGISGSNIVGSYYDDPFQINHHSFFYDGESWTTLDVPGPAYGIDGSNIVGSMNGGQSFLYDGSTWTAFSKPEALDTWAYDISGNKIIGCYYDDIGNREHSFLYDGTTWTTLNAPGAYSTHAYGIDGSNIVGYYDDSHGFLYDGSTWTTLDAPGAIETRAYGISGNNIVGYYRDISGDHGFIYTVPEPATIFLLGVGAVMLRRKRL